MVIRDLTLRSAASFGSFHLIRLLYDEYMFYLVEHRVAEATGETPIAVMGEVRARPPRGPQDSMAVCVTQRTAQGGSSKSCTRLTPNLKGPGVFQAEWGGRGHGAWGDAIRFVSQKAHSGCRVENEFLNLTTNLLCEELTAW